MAWNNVRLTHFSRFSSFVSRGTVMTNQPASALTQEVGRGQTARRTTTHGRISTPVRP
jgi:hypothetical protein